MGEAIEPERYNAFVQALIDDGGTAHPISTGGTGRSPARTNLEISLLPQPPSQCSCSETLHSLQKRLDDLEERVANLRPQET